MSEREFEVYAFRFLQSGKDAGQVCRRWTALGAQHAHQAFGWNVRAFFEVLKSYRRVHVVAQHRLTGSKISVDDTLDERGKPLALNSGRNSIEDLADRRTFHEGSEGSDSRRIGIVVRVFISWSPRS